MAQSTMRREMGTLNAALNFAVARNKISYAPPVSLPQKGMPKDRWLTQDEAALLLANSSPHVAKFIKIGLATGRRKGAILRLKWVPSSNCGWVDLDHGVIHFLGRAEEESKKKKGIVKIPDPLLEDMRCWEREPDHVINFKGEPIGDIKTAFGGAVRRANLTDVTPHTLKHTAVTWAFKGGMRLEEASEFFATSRDTLENVYRSYGPDAQKEAVEVMNSYMGKLCADV
ncbi:tyrosine-type recombinase/integrase [Rhodobacterales bacterium HKCCSP123]|nr:tyrosine-type recombinase/integrase [Rhodobacterales bacterium HKCCSP123]